MVLHGTPIELCREVFHVSKRKEDTNSYTWLFFSYNHSYSLSVQLCSCLSINAATWLALLVCTSSLFERVQVKWVIMKNCSPLPTVGQQLSNRPLNFYMQLMIDNWYTQSRLCSSGARSPQTTNIWSRATEKEKWSPVRAHRFRLVWKLETKPANV